MPHGFRNLQGIRRFSAILMLSLSVMCGTAGAQAPASLPSVASFFELPTLSSAQLSPDGRYVAMLVPLKGGYVRLGVMDVVERIPKVVASFDDADVSGFHWINNNRLVFEAGDRSIGVGDQHRGSGLYAINRDGTEFRQLVERSFQLLAARSNNVHGPLSANNLFYATINDSGDIYLLQFDVTWGNVAKSQAVRPVGLLRLNTKTGRSTMIERPGVTTAWLIDRKGEPRVATTTDGEMASVFYRDPEQNQWRKLTEFNAYTGDGFTPYFFGPDGTLYVSARHGTDKVSLYRYDLNKKSIDPEPVVSLKDYDFSGSIVYNDKKILGVRFETDADDTKWLTPEMQAIQKSVNDLLPSTVNQISVAYHPETPYVLVQSFSDVQPAVYFLYDSAAKKLTLLGSSMPHIDPQQMSAKDMVRYKARDGLEIPAYLTMPKNAGKKNLPLVVLVHGGPFVRGGSWRWNRQVQFLASRGYAVLEPEYRGSTGFGWKHFRAGWKQWGLAMQDDVADGAKWAIAQGIADPKRICIAGASYGGYATLMGLINDPSLYRCGVEWVGVTDINLMYDVNWSDMSVEYLKYGMPLLVGDQEKDAAQLKATSPLVNAARIRQPLLLAYGGSDVRVPIVHGTKFRDAVKASNPNVEWIEYPEEGHGWRLQKNNVDFWTRVEKFLNQQIGKP
ncbi:Dipeptidyl aminopeptidase/acylaminoacyl peptidase [Collimonas sp. OK607]|uniref:alpha/beta hydrolase family protein n=1 Tax=Collimonas sp. OK607 TaxID=1798194 RepID=UPI0008E09B3F|nr:alpha/beta fold hydrolase [Collimonas sp. OK607]SFA90113.1 Dipeptidyl aminopeptidase/acylaminoacyl peptidase [Collimonas sp. OK607]